MKISSKHFIIRIGTIKIYKCPKCKKTEIKIGFNYCPNCGTKIEFEDADEQ